MTEEEKNLSSKLQNLMEKEAGKRKLTLQQIENLIQRHKESIQNVSEYDLTDTQEYYSHWNLISNLGTDYTERLVQKLSYPILLIFFSFSSSMILIFLPSIVISLSVANCDKVRIAFEVVILERFARSSRER